MFSDQRNHHVLVGERRIRIEALSFSRTYGGVVEGRPGPEDLYAWAQAEARRHYGERPTLLLREPPEVRRIPPWTVTAWLDSTPLPDPGGEVHCGSQMVVIFFVPDTHITHRADDLLARLFLDRGVCWEDHAKNWNP